jgi:UMF1 family MFS transporter
MSTPESQVRASIDSTQRLASSQPVEREPPIGSTPLFTRRVISWALYDLANTIFSMNIVSLYLGLWVVNVMGGSDTIWARANATSMLLMLVTAPFLGAISDQAGRRLPFLLVSTLGCVTLTALLGTPGLAGTLALFVFANYFFQAGLVFYDATLPLVSTPETRGRVGGIGIGIGYVGSFIGVATGLALEARFGYVPIFRATALLFLLFAIPIFLFVKEPKRATRFRPSFSTVARAFRQVASTFRQVRRYRGLARFLVGRAFYTDAANTLIVFMGIYVTNEIGFSDTQTQVMLLAAIASAVLGGFLWGPVVDRIGPRRTLVRVLGVWAATLLGAILVPLLSLPPALFWGVAALAGIALGGTWASDRPLMLVLAPPAKVGEFYGLYSMIGRFAAVIGPLLWAFVAESLGLGRPAAVATLLLMIGIAYAILRRVDDTPRDWSPEEMRPAES